MVQLRTWLCFAILLLSALSASRAQNADDGNFKVQLIPVTPVMTARASQALRDYLPQEGKVVAGVNKNGIYTVTGNLFHNDSLYSMVDDDNDVIICKWQMPNWNPLFGININTVWNYPIGYAHQEVLPSPLNQPQPFWFVELSNRSLLVIASKTEKAGQYFYVVFFDPKIEKILDTVTSFGLQPSVKNGYLLSGDSSRNKSESEATYFSKIKNDLFVLVKSGEDSQPWHSGDTESQLDDSSTYVMSNGKGYVLLPDNSGSKNPADYLIVRCDPGEKQPILHPPVDKPFASIYFTQNKAKWVGDPTIFYLFAKLTDLPMEMCPGYDPSIDKIMISHLQGEFAVKGTDKEIVKLLTP